MSAQPRRSDGRMRLLLALLGLVGLASLSVPLLLVPPASLHVTLVDAVFHESLVGRAVTLGGSIGERRTVARGEAGASFAQVARIAAGAHHVTVAVDGYALAELSIVAAPLAQARAEVALQPQFGRVRVTAIDARSEATAVDAPLRVSAAGRVAGGIGEVIISGLPPGAQRIGVEADGFCSGDADATLQAGQTAELKVPLSPALAANEAARILLDWAPQPRDLDATLLLPEGAAPRRFVYFGNKSAKDATGRDLARLDVDHTNSEGVETMTIYNGMPGTYAYAVHRYAGEGSIATSGATVDVQTAGCGRQRYRPTADCRGDWWVVVQLRLGSGPPQIVDGGGCAERVVGGWRAMAK